MSENTTPTDTNRTEENWAVEYDVEPIRIRDPVAEALAVLEPGEPFVVTYENLVKAAGHSCPTASGAYRIAQLGLNALYPDELPVRTRPRYSLRGRATTPRTASWDASPRT